MKGMTLLLIVGVVGYLMYVRTPPDGVPGDNKGAGGASGHKTLGDFVDEFASLLNSAAGAVAGSSGSDASNAPATSNSEVSI